MLFWLMGDLSQTDTALGAGIALVTLLVLAIGTGAQLDLLASAS